MNTHVPQMMSSQLDSDSKNIRLPLEGERLKRWEAFVSKRMITQQAALLALMDWIVEQEDMTQAMVLGQIPAAPDIVELILRRMVADESRKKSASRGAKLLRAASNKKDLHD